jgi:hypothetical protein
MGPARYSAQALVNPNYPEPARRADGSTEILADGRAELLLSDLIMRDLHLYVPPADLTQFIRGNWWVLSIYAHRIHGS